MKIRIIPLVIFISFISVVVKVFDTAIERIGTSSDSASQYSQIQALAQEQDEEEVSEDDEEASENDEEAYLSPNYSGGGPSELDVTNMSEMERGLLENLAKRRAELEDWSASIAMKENVLNATEKKINVKMEELKSLQREVQKLLKDYNEKENTKVQHLVKIYESMKPQSAASIFAEMDIEILLEVVERMSETKAAKILAKLDSTKAKEITTRLAKQRRLSSH